MSDDVLRWKDGTPPMVAHIHGHVPTPRERVHAIELLTAAAQYTEKRGRVEAILVEQGLFDENDLEACWVAQKIVDALED